MTEEPLITDAGQLDAKGLEAMLARIRAKSEEFERHLSKCPQTKDCPTCGSQATLDVDASFKAQAPAYVCEACKQQRAEQRFIAACDAAGIPSDVRHATLDNFRTDRPHIEPKYQTPEQFVAAVRQFLTKGKRNIILAGKAGIGKGHLGAAIAMHFIRLGWKVAWVECARLFRDYHSSYQHQKNEQITNRLGTIGLLVIDEICLRDLPADGEEILFAILDRRHKDGRPTVFLGNKTAAEIRSWLGERITDRLRSGGVIFCYGEWQSMRGHASDGSQTKEEF